MDVDKAYDFALLLFCFLQFFFWFDEILDSRLILCLKLDPLFCLLGLTVIWV